MQVFYLLLGAFLLANLAAALLRVIRGPGTADRLMTAQLFGTTGVAVLLLLAEAMEAAALRDTALVFVLLAVLIVAAFTRTEGTEERRPAGKGS
ncbi:MAG: pH regulation protein F [Puniceicoccaceae bacterium]|nr:MAG: pH regulation protein F [Puniceicoccaceae bacterium]